MDRIRVLIADDEQVVRESLASVIGSDPSLEIVGSAKDAQGAIDLAAWRLPDVALLDVRMPGGGPRAAAEIARLSPSTRVLALSAAEDRESVLAMIRAGALSYVGKTASNEEILNAIHGTAEGGTQLSPRAVNGVFEAIADTGEGDRSSNGNGSPPGSGPREQIERIIERQAVELAYQPLADLVTLRVVAVEALPRFRTRPMRSPESWLVEAAKHGWLLDLELVALNAALGHVGMLPSDVFLAVSISLETALSGRFRDLIRGSDQSRIALELNEYSADQLPTGALDELRGDGVRVRRIGAAEPSSHREAGAGPHQGGHVDVPRDVRRPDGARARVVVHRVGVRHRGHGRCRRCRDGARGRDAATTRDRSRSGQLPRSPRADPERRRRLGAHDDERRSDRDRYLTLTRPPLVAVLHAWRKISEAHVVAPVQLLAHGDGSVHAGAIAHALSKDTLRSIAEPVV